MHYIIGNHELKMMYGDYGVTDPKYAEVASLLGKEQTDLYGSDSVLGRWMASKNTVERINGNLFVHGGMHPDLADRDWDIDEINETIRQTYYERVGSARSGQPGQETGITDLPPRDREQPRCSQTQRKRKMENSMKRDVTFNSAGDKVVGDLYLPGAFSPSKKYPAVVVGGPLGTVKEPSRRGHPL